MSTFDMIKNAIDDIHGKYVMPKCSYYNGTGTYNPPLFWLTKTCSIGRFSTSTELHHCTVDKYGRLETIGDKVEIPGNVEPGWYCGVVML